MGEVNGSAGAPKPPKTCDNCRKRKIKCMEDELDPETRPCDGCRKLSLDCTYNYVKKKPGRKNTFAMAMKAVQDGADAANDFGLPNGNDHMHGQANGNGNGNGHGHGPGGIGVHRTPSFNQHNHYMPYPYPSIPQPSPHRHAPPLPSSLLLSTPETLSHPTSHSHPTSSSADYPTPANIPLSIPPISAPTPGRPFSSFAFSPSALRSDAGLGWLDSILDTSGNWGADPFGNTSAAVQSQFPSEQAHLLSLESPEHMLMASTSSNPGTTLNGPTTHPLRREPQLEDVTSWANISHFISLFLQYLYPLLPLVHRPTFAENLATRRDLRDTDFRALLLSIVAYVISQLPTSRLVTDQFDIEGLKHLQRRCHRTCKALQRTYYGPTNLTQITTIIFDCFYLLSIGLGHTAAARLGQAIQLAFSMGMHSDAKTEALGLDSIETQLRRRVFWQLYTSDKTRAIPGPPMLINDFQGVPSLPEPIDDEFITSQGFFPQPPNRTSVLSGFVAIAKEFRIISECFFHHRYILNSLGETSAHGSILNRTVKMVDTDWTVEAEDRLHKILREMPSVIQDPSTVQGANGKMSVIGTGGAGREVFAMQRANILITAAIAKFALYDLRSALDVDEESLGREREAIAREIHSLLMNIPVEDLASNGESVRGKVFHIACALCVQAPNAADTDLVRDWCNMFSAISFVQMPPPPPEAALDSRAGTPPGTLAMTALSSSTATQNLLSNNTGPRDIISAPTNRST